MNTRLRSFIASALATTLMTFSAVNYADDTEIYFAQANVGNEENKPAANVLFLIDTSGSMCYYDGGGTSQSCSRSTSRMNKLKEAFNIMIDSLDERVSVGVGKFNGWPSQDHAHGGYVFHPVSPMSDSAKSTIKTRVGSLDGTANTPTAEAYSEMARYMLGLPPTNYAKEGEAITNTPRPAVNMRPVTERVWDNCANWSFWSGCQGDWVNQQVWESDTLYDSPINMANQCETNHIIIMTDGAPTQDLESSAVNSITGGNCVIPPVTPTQDNPNPEINSFACQAELASWLHNDGEDRDNRKSIRTWQIGFGIEEGSTQANRMESVASAGGTDEVKFADSAEQLADAFLDIMDLIDGESRSISAPGIAVNTMNRFQHLDELYYAVFQPAESSYWEGNLKSYRLKGQEVHGQNGLATDPTTGYFTDESQSYWSDEVDGADAQKGGARENVGARKLFYSTANGETEALSWTSNWNQTPTNDFFGLSTANSDRDSERNAMFDRLKTMWGDPMHSVPLMVNYGGEQNYVFVSTNGGMLHIIDTSDGSEAATFMPHEMFEKAPQFTTNRPGLRDGNIRQLYGLDASWIAWRKPGANPTAAPSKVYLYGGMRRGGETFYALDVTDPENPELKWQIDRGDTGFDRLGQTWSTPTLTRFPTAGGSVPALVFGGGYSPTDHDNHQNRKIADAMGNAVYIVNAENGNLLWTANHSDMKWAIPGGVSVVDTNLDGVADFLYFADLGGQVFRATLDPGKRSVERIAELGGSGTSHRRFYEAPSVAYVKDGAENHLYVAVASGYRAHPLDETTDEGLFVVIDKDAMGSSTSAVATLSNMANVVVNQEVDDDRPRGWYYLFEADNGPSGEKALASPTIYANTVMLSTYAPTVDQEYDNPCAVRYGAAYLHSVDLRTGKPAFFDRDITQPENRRRSLTQSTPPPTPTLMIDERGKLVTIVGTEVIDEDDLDDLELRKRRWMQLPKNEAGEILPASD